MFVFFLNILRQKSGRYVCVQLLQTLNILFENISHETSLCKDTPCHLPVYCSVSGGPTRLGPAHFSLPRLYPSRLSSLDSRSVLPLSRKMDIQFEAEVRAGFWWGFLSL